MKLTFNKLFLILCLIFGTLYFGICVMYFIVDCPTLVFYEYSVEEYYTQAVNIIYYSTMECALAQLPETISRLVTVSICSSQSQETLSEIADLLIKGFFLNAFVLFVIRMRIKSKVSVLNLNSDE